MAPRKSARTATAAPQPGSRSTAQVFLQPEETKPEPPAPEPIQKTESADDDDPSNYNFPLNYIFAAQDFLNENLDTAKFVQIMSLGYICQVLYLNNEELFWQKYQLIGYNLAGIVVSIFLAESSHKKNHGINPTKYPYLAPYPEFQHLYSVILPLTLTFLLQPEDLLLTLSLNSFVVDNLPIAITFVSAFMFSFIYNSLDINYTTTKHLLVYTFIKLFLKYVNEADDDYNEDEDQEYEEESDYDSEEDDDDDEDDEDEESEEENENETEENKSSFISERPPPKKVTSTNAELHLISLLLTKILATDYEITSLEDPTLSLVILKALLTSLISAALFVYPLFTYYKTFEPKQPLAKILASVIITIAGGLVILLTDYQLRSTLRTNPINWIFNYIILSPDRLKLVGIWTSNLIGLVTFVFVFADKVSLNLRRKIWHVAIFVTLFLTKGLTEQTQLTFVALTGFLFLMIVAEIFRYLKFTIVGEILHSQLRLFQDQKDLNGPLNLSYIYLLVGVSIPIFINTIILGQLVSEYSYLGLIFLGIGDSFASIVGKKYGNIRWRGSDKTVEGSLAFFFSTLLSFYFINVFLGIRIVNWEATFVTCLLGTFIEGTSDMNDNLLIPVIGFVSLYALNKTPI